MVQSRPELVGKSLGAFSRDYSVNLRIEHAVDISDECPERYDLSCRMLLLYTRVENDQLCFLADCATKNNAGDIENVTLQDPWLMSELNALSPHAQFILDTLAKCCGISSQELRELMAQYAPDEASVAA